MIDIVIIAIVVAVLAAAGFCIFRAKKQGCKCIGCPNGRSCSGHCGGTHHGSSHF